MLQPDPVQTTYNQYLTVAQLGTPASSSGWDVDSKIAEDLASPKAGIAFGVAVSQGTLHGDRSVAVGKLSGRGFVGITASDVTLPNVDSSFTDLYQDGDNVAVAVRGDWWVAPSTDVAAGDPVYFDNTTGALGNTGDTLIENARWMTSTPTSGDTTQEPPFAGVNTAGLAVVRLGASSQ